MTLLDDVTADTAVDAAVDGLRVAVVVGNPKASSRTLTAATYVATELAGRAPDVVVDLATLGPAVLDWADPVVGGLVADVGSADLVVVASPTHKSAYTGLLKVFLDRFARFTGLSGVAVPMMLGAAAEHALAPELLLRPVLVEIGGTVPGRALFVPEAHHDDPTAYADWLAAVRPVTQTLLAARRTAREGATP